MIRLALLMLMAFACSAARAAAPPQAEVRNEKLLLALGNSLEIEIPPQSSLRLSQKKIVEIETLSPERFRLLAVRKGLVYLRALNEEGILLRSWLVEVESPSAQDQRHALEDREWYTAFCQEKGVSCLKDKRLVRGETDSLPWLHLMRKRCEKELPCRFEVKLSPVAQELWRQKLEEEWGQGPLEVASDGFVIMRSSCSGSEAQEFKNAVESFRRILAERYGAPVLQPCRGQGENSFVLDILAVAQRSDGAERDNPLAWEGLSLPPNLPLRAMIRGLSESGRAQVIAQPLVQLSEGGEVLISDGFEIQTLAHEDGHTESSWKAVGFTLRCSYLEKRGDKARLKIELQLSRPRGSKLDMSRLETETWLAIRRWQLIGRIQASTDGEEQSAVPWFASIPFIGGLFRWSVDQKASSEVSLFARLRGLDDSLEQSDAAIEGLGFKSSPLRPLKEGTADP